jgi:hypothetical protein
MHIKDIQRTIGGLHQPTLKKNKKQNKQKKKQKTKKQKKKQTY